MEGRGVSGIKVTDLEEDAGLESVPVLLDRFRGEGGRSVRDRFVVLVRHKLGRYGRYIGLVYLYGILFDTTENID